MPSHEPAIEFICFLPTSWKQKSWLSGRRYRGRKLSHRGRINLLTLGPLWPVSLLSSSLSHDSPATCCFIQVRRCPNSHSGWSAELNSHHFQKAFPQHDKILQTLFLLMFWDFIYLFMSPFIHSFIQIPHVVSEPPLRTTSHGYCSIGPGAIVALHLDHSRYGPRGKYCQASSLFVWWSQQQWEKGDVRWEKGRQLIKAGHQGSTLPVEILDAGLQHRLQNYPLQRPKELGGLHTDLC